MGGNLPSTRLPVSAKCLASRPMHATSTGLRMGTPKQPERLEQRKPNKAHAFKPQDV